MDHDKTCFVSLHFLYHRRSKHAEKGMRRKEGRRKFSEAYPSLDSVFFSSSLFSRFFQSRARCDILVAVLFAVYRKGRQGDNLRRCIDDYRLLDLETREVFSLRQESSADCAIKSYLICLVSASL